MIPAPRAIVYLENLSHNLRVIRDHLPGGTKICFPVKANAYGHGLVDVARAAEEEGVEALAVAFFQEGLKLRQGGISLPILMMSPPLAEEIPGLVEEEIEPFAAHRASLELLSREGARQKRRVRVHLKVDTGMGRNGCFPEEALPLAQHIADDPHLVLAGLCTHFAGSDMDDTGFTRNQIRIFKETLAKITAAKIHPQIVHAANSGAVIWYPEASFDMVRPGILTYGYYPSPKQPRPLAVRPLMALETQVVHLKRVPPNTPLSYGLTYRTPGEDWIATLRIGYGDGYFRILAGQGRAIIGGRSYPIVGRVCMDHALANLGSTTSVKLYDRAILFGPQPGGPDAEELANAAGTISYEILTAVDPRVGRQYIR